LGGLDEWRIFAITESIENIVDIILQPDSSIERALIGGGVGVSDLQLSLLTLITLDRGSLE
jgi:hypothetical protein